MIPEYTGTAPPLIRTVAEIREVMAELGRSPGEIERQLGALELHTQAVRLLAALRNELDARGKVVPLMPWHRRHGWRPEPQTTTAYEMFVPTSEQIDRAISREVARSARTARLRADPLGLYERPDTIDELVKVQDERWK
jgi:hypothetical protein